MKKTWEDFEVGSTFKTVGITITESHIVTFAGLTGDNHPIQMNEEFAKQTIFGTRIAHGMLVFSVAAGLVLQSGFLADAIISFIKVRDLTFLRPVKLGDTIHVEVTVDEKAETSKPDKGILMLKYDVKNQTDTMVISSKLDFMAFRKKQ